MSTRAARATRAWTLLGLVIFAALSLAVSRYWENVLLTSIHGNSGTVRRDQAEYFASTWLVAFIVSSVAAAWTLVGMITKRSSAHGHHEQFDDVEEQQQPIEQQRAPEPAPFELPRRRSYRSAVHRRPLDRAA